MPLCISVTSFIFVYIDYLDMKRGSGVQVRRQIDSATEIPAITVVEAVAEAKGVPKRSLDPLEYAISTDSLTELVAADTPTVLSFEYEGHPVVVDETDTVVGYSAETPFEDIRQLVSPGRA